MSGIHRSRLVSVCLVVIILLSSLGMNVVSEAPNSVAQAPTSTAIPTKVQSPTETSTPVVQPDAEPAAWVDGALDLDQFAPRETFIVHFNTAMSQESTANPLLSWPVVEGVSKWDAAKTTLSFTPNSALSSKDTYSFFLDPSLRSASGKPLKNATDWVVRVQAGPTVKSLAPEPGTLESRSKAIEVTFDRPMDTAIVQDALSIQPSVSFDLKWKNAGRVLQILLREPLEPGQRYDLTLKGGGAEGTLFAQDGTYLAEEYRWFYWQDEFEINAALTAASTVAVKFNYALDQKKTGVPFVIAPELAGEWKWFTNKEIRFQAKEPISASTKYDLELAQPLVDANGFETSAIPAISLSGLPPIRLINITKSQYSDNLYADLDLESIRLEFGTAVDHASVEKAFSLQPAAPGRIQWEKLPGASKETLVYALDTLLKQNTTYTIKIDSGALDAAGNTLLVQPFEKTFFTSYSGYLSESFGEMGANVQVMDANGPRKLQFSGGSEAASFSAYRFDLIDFAKLYAEHYHYREWGNAVRDIPIPADLQPAATWKNITSRKVNDETITETTIPFDLAPGLYVLNLRKGRFLYDQLFLVITSKTLAVKNDGDDLFVWLTDINGGNVPDAEIRVYSATGEKIREGKTDENGQYRVSIPVGEEPMLVSARLLEHGASGDVALAGFYGWGTREYSDYSDPSRFYPEGQPYLVYIYTERPIYRPGQTVNFKAVIRKDNDVHYELPVEGSPVKIRVMDARGNTLENMELLTNRFGTVNSTFALSEGAMLGDYQIETDFNGVVTSQTFQVEDYRKPDYQIKLTSLQPEKNDRFVQGEEMKVQVHASYYFGEPLANAMLDVQFFYIWPLSTKVTGSLVTDEQGNAAVTFRAPYNPDYDDYYWGPNSGFQRVRMEVTANDGSNQTVTGVHYFSVYPASEILDLDTDGNYAQPGESIPVTVKATDLFGQPVAGRTLTLSVQSWDRTRYEYGKATQKFELLTDESGIAAEEITLSAGYHQLTLSGQDALGNSVEVKRWIYVFKSKDDWFDRNQSEYLMISAEKESYKPYETARFAIESTFSGPALLTFERGSVINTKMVELTAPLTLIESEIIPEHAPNVFVTINAWQDGTPEVGRSRYWYFVETYADSYLRTASTHVKVDSTAKALDIEIATDKQTYAPGESMNAVVTVKDQNGAPVLAELSLAVVDEAIYGLANDPAANIFDAFYGPRGHSVYTFDSMAPTRIIFTGGQGGGDDQPPAAARSEFLDTSAWLPAVETDASGQAKATIDLPDNTTSWRISVKAITLKHLVGQASTTVETKKAVFVRPSLPRILTTGDQAVLTAFVHNYSAETQTIQLQLSAPGLEIRNEEKQSLVLKAGEVLPVGWQVRVQSAKPTELVFTATGAKGILDSISLPLNLQPAAVQDFHNQSGQFDGTLTLPLPLPNVERETSNVRLSLNRSMSGTLLNGLEYLTGYPYGCVEQTMSRALPNAVVGRAANQLGIGGEEMTARLDPLIAASIQRLYGLQHGDGGWGWWTDDVSDAYQTAWVLFGLGVMNESGYSIEPKVMDNAASWLKQSVGMESELDIRTRAYALYSLAQAGRGDLELTRELATQSVYELDPFSQAALALALDRLGEDEQARDILEILSQSAVKDGEHVYWPQPSYDGEYHGKTMASTTRTTALVLLAYTQIDSQNALVPEIVRYLADQRQGVYGWGTTNETSFTILALTEYLVNEENKLGSTPYELLVNGKPLANGIFQVGNASASLEISLAQLQDGMNTLVVRTDAGASLYYDLSTRYDLLQSDTAAAGTLQVERRYLDPKTKLPIDHFQAGQLVKVQVQVQGSQDVSFLAVEDYLPGGFEALNEGLNASSQIGYDRWGSELYTEFYWEEYGYNYKEIRGDRVVFFITSFPRGTRTFSYYARATTSGQFVALPAQAYAMYDFDLWGRSERATIQINK